MVRAFIFSSVFAALGVAGEVSADSTDSLIDQISNIEGQVNSSPVIKHRYPDTTPTAPESVPTQAEQEAIRKRVESILAGEKVRAPGSDTVKGSDSAKK